MLWFKDAVKRYLRSSRVPDLILRDAVKKLDAKEATLRVIPSVLEQLETFGSSGEVPMRAMLTEMHNWSSFDSIPEPRRSAAKRSVKRLQEVYSSFLSQRSFEERKQREEYEKQAQEERVARTQLTALDHSKLQAFRDRFEAAFVVPTEKERGDRFEQLMNDIFGYYTEPV